LTQEFGNFKSSGYRARGGRFCFQHDQCRTFSRRPGRPRPATPPARRGIVRRDVTIPVSEQDRKHLDERCGFQPSQAVPIPPQPCRQVENAPCRQPSRGA